MRQIYGHPHQLYPNRLFRNLYRQPPHQVKIVHLMGEPTKSKVRILMVHNVCDNDESVVFILNRFVEPKPRSAPLERWAAGKVALQRMKSAMVSKQNELHDEWFTKLQENKLKWETKLYSLQCDEIERRMAMAADKHQLEMELLKKKCL